MCVCVALWKQAASPGERCDGSTSVHENNIKPAESVTLDGLKSDLLHFNQITFPVITTRIILLSSARAIISKGLSQRPGPEITGKIIELKTTGRKKPEKI